VLFQEFQLPVMQFNVRDTAVPYIKRGEAAEHQKSRKITQIIKL
jgi:hypothetical protein